MIKMQPVIRQTLMRGHELVFVHTGQHFDYEMSDIFVGELELPKPDYFLNVKSSSQGIQTANTIVGCERILSSEKPDIALVEGDTNSALGASIAASKLHIPIGHVEAGCRSFDKFMPEEINRVLISDIADYHFAPTKNCVDNLLREGIQRSQIFLTGHPIVDLINQIRGKIPNNNLVKDSYALVTIHRRENITDKKRIINLLNALTNLSQRIRLIFPCHPHTESQIRKYHLSNYLRKLNVIRPVGYLDSLGFIKHSKFVLTDSGGIQQEAAILHTPCITLRDETEWIETTEAGVNFLAGNSTGKILEVAERIEKRYNHIIKVLNRRQNLFGTIGVSKRILRTIEKDKRILKKS